jgi:CRP/FNR family cyclic AMP-dependent transcriptional regulator
MVCNYKVLDTVDSDTKEKLLQGHREIQIPSAHQLILQADWGEEAYVLVSGILKARCLSAQGDEIVISLMGAGAIVGEVALLAPNPIRTVDVVAVTPARLLKLRQHAMREAMENNLTFTRSIAFLQAQRLTALGDRLMLMNADAMTRLLATLLDLARLNGDKDDPLQPIPLIPQHEMALMAGLSRGTTSTLINKLISNGTLQRHDNSMQFVSLVPLQRRSLLPKQ